MKVSILIPAHNAAPYIRETLESCLHQDTSFLEEIIVVDDHSVDKTANIAKDIATKHDYIAIKVIPNEGRGACQARNLAFQSSKGELIQWLDADDILGRDKISKQRQHLTNGNSILVVSPFKSFVESPESGTIEDNRDWSCASTMTPADWLASGMMTIPACWLGHRSVFESAGPWDTSLRVNQDGEYFARALAAANRLHFEPDALAWYRRGVTGSVSSFTPEKAESLFRSIESIHQTTLSLEDSPRMRQMLANKYQHAIYTAYPHCPKGIAKAKVKLKALPKPTIANPNTVSSISKVIASLFGWKSLTRLRMLKAQLSS